MIIGAGLEWMGNYWRMSENRGMRGGEGRTGCQKLKVPEGGIDDMYVKHANISQCESNMLPVRAGVVKAVADPETLERGPRNMKYKPPCSTAIFCLAYFYKPGWGSPWIRY